MNTSHSLSRKAPAVKKSYASAQEALEDKVRLVQDFPEKGVLFEDLTPVLADAEAFATVVDGLAEACEKLGAEMIGGLDARGFLLGSAVAYKLGLGILAIRKAGKLPPPVFHQEYELEYGSAALEIPRNGADIKGTNVVLVDDVLATGGTLYGAKLLLEAAGANVAGSVVIIEVPGLGGRERVSDAPLVVLGNKD
ncbi:adenine phosphoribosyltransferase [Corynebacterium phocae]|uniref:Adenine phosphoribosyltransferase n=1 Tax=Corynebacterium phocae TaxID=161895 RepID=A0A1L7D3B5_9CORY|nr:adenine phosphoribosyltransferase [Corynebacterium phocae]APT92422.1 adenine phosphoribosyltransferase [Corynebacterium phocae]KAA8725022.1 adenine phosphoribosyltransferase [Corynebacterium phocae]